MSAPRIPISGLTGSQFAEMAKSQLPRGAGRAKRVYRYSMEQGRLAIDGLGLAADSQAGYLNRYSVPLPSLGRVVEEDTDQGVTAKATLRGEGGLEYECVYLPMGRGRSTLCISSQVGCKMGCSFCETGRMGLLRNLSAAEIVGQLLVARHRLGWNFRNIVFMGMGEALDNTDAVIPALRIMSDPAGLAIGLDRITVCTAGHIAGLKKLKQAGFKRLNVSISLNAASDRLRNELMPVNRRTPLAELQAALVDYRPRANFALGVNYCLLPGLNDAETDILRIADFCAPLGRIMLNVIPYNPGSSPVTRAPTEAEVVRFIEGARAAGLSVRRRVTKGRSVMAACGQLGNVDLRAQVREQRKRIHLPQVSK